VGRHDDEERFSQKEILFTAAVLYYEKDRSQAQIAEELGVSKATVSRLLARARETGIVKIQIVPPTFDPELGPDVRDRLGLSSVHIAPGIADAADPGPLLSRLADQALADLGLKTGDVVLVAWGRAVYSLARCISTPCPGAVVVPALGGTDDDQPWFQPNEIARRFAANINAAVRYLHAPAHVSPALKRSLLEEPAIRATLDLWQTAAAAVVGIGQWPKSDPSLVAVGLHADDPAITIGVGDVVARFFTEDGDLVHTQDEPGLLGITPEQLRNLRHVIAVAVGVDKASAIIGAARARLITTLITDAATARAVADRLGRITSPEVSAHRS
jgi:DNA-binding transcriptional regulator LsrR (DeoR family)